MRLGRRRQEGADHCVPVRRHQLLSDLQTRYLGEQLHRARQEAGGEG